MTFRDLEYVVTVAETLNFSKAAEQCHVSQPSLSSQVKKLEDEVGLSLFVRSKRKVHLTPFGKEFVEKAQRILESQQELYHLADEQKDPLEGSLKIGAILTVAPYLCPEMITKLAVEAPQLKISLKEATTEELVKSLLNGDIDMAIVSLPSDDHIFHSQALFNDSFHLAIHPEHPLAKEEKVDLKKLQNTELILLEEGHCFRQQALDVCQTVLAKENQTFVASSLETIRRYIETAGGATLMPSIAKNMNDGLHYISLENPKFSREIGVIWNRSSIKQRQIDSLLEIFSKIDFEHLLH